MLVAQTEYLMKKERSVSQWKIPRIFDQFCFALGENTAGVIVKEND